MHYKKLKFKRKISRSHYMNKQRVYRLAVSQGYKSLINRKKCPSSLIILCMYVKVTQSCLSLCNPMDYTVHGILQTRILNWVAVPFSKGSSQLRDQTQLSWISCRFFTSWASREGYKHFYYPQKHSPHSLGSRCLFLLYPRTLLSDKQPSFCINGFTNSIYSMHMEWDYIGLFESGFFHLACSWGSFT